MSDMEDIEEIRAEIGKSAFEVFDLIDEELYKALKEYIPALHTMAEALSEWPTKQRLQMLTSMAISAGLRAANGDD